MAGSAVLAAEPGPPVDTAERMLRLAPDLDEVPVGEQLVLSTATATLRLDGGVARLVRDRLLPWRAWAPRAARCVRPGRSPMEDVERVVERLVAAGLFVEATTVGPAPPSWTSLVTASLDERLAIATRLAGLRVVVVGLRGVGRAVVESLATLGVGAVVLVDPLQAYPDEFDDERRPSSSDLRREDLVG